MGLIKASIDSARTAIGDQFLEVVSCPEVGKDVIVQRGVVSHGSGNKVFTDGVISNGSHVIVPQGMAMMIVDNGKVVEFSADPGTFVYDSSTEPSVFVGGLGKGIINSIKTIGQRITFGGQAPKDQRVYYINIKTMTGFTFGSKQPEVIEDPVYESVEVTYNGEFAIKVDDPVILVNEILGSNPKDTLTFDDIFSQEGDNQLRGKFAQKVSEAITSIMVDNEVSFRQIQKYKSEVTDKMNDLLDEDWTQKYGIIVQDVTLRINASEESLKVIQEMDKEVATTRRVGAEYSKNMTGATAGAVGTAMKNAASNPNGALGGFVGFGVAQNAGAGVLGAASNIENAAKANNGETVSYCSNCGNPASGNFCTNCGNKLN